MNQAKLKEDQLKLAKKVVVKDEFEKKEFIGGVDQAFLDNKVISAIVVCEFPSMKIIEKKHAIVEAAMPYIPGFLSFREAPAIIEAFNLLEQRPDILLVDGNGILHPRKIGLASHVGISLNVPTIGVAKNLLCGQIKPDKKITYQDDVIGMELVTREFAKPLYISPGHKVCLRTALKTVKECMREPHKLPEPLHHAHRYSKEVRREMEKKEKNFVGLNTY